MEDMGVQFMSGQSTAKFTCVTNEIDTVNNEIDKIKENCNDLDRRIHNEEATRLNVDMQIMQYANGLESRIITNEETQKRILEPIINVLCAIVISWWFRFFNHFAMMVRYRIEVNTIIISPLFKETTRDQFKQYEKEFKQQLKEEKKKYPYNRKLTKDYTVSFKF